MSIEEFFNFLRDCRMLKETVDPELAKAKNLNLLSGADIDLMYTKALSYQNSQ